MRGYEGVMNWWQYIANFEQYIAEIEQYIAHFMVDEKIFQMFFLDFLFFATD